MQIDQFIGRYFIVECATFAAVASLASLLIFGIRRLDPRIRARVRVVSDRDAMKAAPKARTSSALERAFQRPLPQQLASYLIPDSEASRLRVRSMLIQAGIYSSQGLIVFFAMRVILLAVPVIAAVSIAKLWRVEYLPAACAGLFLGTAGLILPTLWLQGKINARQATLRNSLPDFLDLIVACVESGLALQMAISRVSTELRAAHPVLADEISISMRQIEFGRTLGVATQDLAQRTGLEELRLFAAFIQQAQRWGAGTAGAMRELADMLRTKRELRAEERAQKASVKLMIPMLLFIFPAVFVVLAGPAAIRIHDAFAQQKTTLNASK